MDYFVAQRMVTTEDLEKLEAYINENLTTANLPVRIAIKQFTSTPIYSLEHSLMYFRTVDKGAHLRVWEIVNEHFTKWLKDLEIMTV